jgi:ABC-2 type transport system ATP-binding protein
MARRLGVAHALVHDPGLVLLDEPTSGLDPRQRVRLRATVRALASDRMVLVSTHLVEDVRGLADRVVVLDDGTIRFDGNVPALEALDTPDAPGDTPLERAITALMGDGS